LVVDGKPFLALAGELDNNSATSVEYMRPTWERLVQANVNMPLAGVSWAQIEPEAGKFDFHAIDGVIRDARAHHMHLGLLWFASWKNGLSSYVPDWVKKDFERFPRARTQAGATLELLTPLSDANRDADASAFAALLRHLRETDGREHTVLLIQVENEVGVLRDSRDHSTLANQAFNGPVPKELMDYLQQRKDKLIPEFLDVWKAAGFKTSGTWEQVFGPGRPEKFEIPIRVDSPPYKPEDLESWRKLHWPADEIFMAWNYARYVNKVAEAGKKEYNIPMYANAWLQQPNYPWPGVYPSGGPEPQVMDIWQAAAPSIDIFAPDLYLEYFAEVCARFNRNGNPLFIPETRGGADGAAKALYAFGRHDAIGFSPMGIDRSKIPDEDLIGSYDLIRQLTPLILEHQGNGTMSAVLLAPNDPPQKVRVGNHTLEARYLRPRDAPESQQPLHLTSAIFISTGPDEYYVAGKGVSIIFSPNTPGPELDGLGTVEEGVLVGGHWTPGRRLAGDDTGQGASVDLHHKGIQRVTLYRYR
jgi:ABC-type transporter Mla MlaB component